MQRAGKGACRRQRRANRQSPYLAEPEAPTRLSARQPKSRERRVEANGENATRRDTHWRDASTASHTRCVPVRAADINSATIVSSTKSGAVPRIPSSSSTQAAPISAAQANIAPKRRARAHVSAGPCGSAAKAIAPQLMPRHAHAVMTHSTTCTPCGKLSAHRTRCLNQGSDIGATTGMACDCGTPAPAVIRTELILQLPFPLGICWEAATK